MIIYTARWVLPVAAPPIEHGCVAVSDTGEITFVGPRREAPASVSSEITLGNSIITPGLVNCHTHLDLTALRGAINEPSFFGWIRRLVELKARWLDSSGLHASAVAGVAEGLLAGMTTFADTSDNDAAFRAMLQMHVRGIAYQEVFGPAPSQCASAVNGLRERVAQLRDSETHLVRLGLSPHAPYTVSDDLYAACAALAEESALPMAVHIAESTAEWEYVVNGAGEFAELLRNRGIEVVPRGRTPLDVLQRTGVLSRAPLLIHAVNVDEYDLQLAAQHRCAIAHCPVSNLRHGNGVAPLLRILAAGVTVGLGTDSVVSSGRLDLIEEARTTRLLQDAMTTERPSLTSHGLLELLTVGGARALGIDASTGTLEAGKRADIVAFAMEQDVPVPAADPEAALLSAMRASDVRMVVVDGRVLVADGKLQADVSTELAMVRSIEQQLRPGSESPVEFRTPTGSQS